MGLLHMSSYTQLPGSLGLSFRRGDELGTSIDFTPTNLTGYTVTSAIVSLVSGDVVQPITVSIANATAGVVNISLSETQTAALPAGTYSWHMAWDAPGSVRRTALQGMVEVTR